MKKLLFWLARREKAWDYKDHMQYTQAIITGASSGFGAEFARQLAPQCRRLLLVARRESLLHELAESLRAKHKGVQIEVIPCDLADETARVRLLQMHGLVQAGRTLLVNNAGLGDYGEFAGSDPARNRSLLQVNICALVELTRGLLPLLKEQGGGIINIASLAADLPIPDFALYAASKAFVASFSEALRLELKELGIPVACICPGPSHTGFGEVARRGGCNDGKSSFRKFFYTPVPVVVNAALKALAANQPRCYPSLKVRLAGLLLRSMPLVCLRSVLSLRPRRVTSVANTAQK